MSVLADWRRVRAERRLWSGARTLDDLGELTARWLDRTIWDHPGYPGKEGPDPETMPIAQNLAAINRCGFVTMSSQPGVIDGAYRQRAAVEGLTDPQTAAHLQAMGYPGLHVIVHTRTPHRRTGYDAVVPVTVHGDQVYTRFGANLSRRDIAMDFARTTGPALEEAFEATQVTLIDLDWGRNTLWSWLVATLAENAVPPQEERLW